jgi:hypothetical protein
MNRIVHMILLSLAIFGLVVNAVGLILFLAGFIKMIV